MGTNAVNRRIESCGDADWSVAKSCAVVDEAHGGGEVAGPGHALLEVIEADARCTSVQLLARNGAVPSEPQRVGAFLRLTRTPLPNKNASSEGFVGDLGLSAGVE